MKAFRWSLAAVCAVYLTFAGIDLNNEEETPFLAFVLSVRTQQGRKKRG